MKCLYTKESMVRGWSRSRIPENTRGRNRKESDFFCLNPISEIQLDHFLHHSCKLRIPVEMSLFPMKLLLKQRILAVYHDFY